MNNRQKAIIEKIIEEKERDFIIELLDHFLERGLGSVSKSETDIFLFYILDKYQKEVKLSNFQLSSLLKISERKVKNLRLEVGIRYHSDSEMDVFNSYVKILELITEGYLEFIGTKEVIIIIEDTYLLRFIESELKSMRVALNDYSLNPEKVKLKIESLEKLLERAAKEITGSADMAIAVAILKNAKWKNYRNETGKEVFDILKKSMPTLMKSLIFPV